MDWFHSLVLLRSLVLTDRPKGKGYTLIIICVHVTLFPRYQRFIGLSSSVTPWIELIHEGIM